MSDEIPLYCICSDNKNDFPNYYCPKHGMFAEPEMDKLEIAELEQRLEELKAKVEAAEEPAPIYPLEWLRETGLLWLINREVFHPRGYALAVYHDEGFQLFGDGKDPWSFGEGVPEQELFDKVKELLK